MGKESYHRREDERSLSEYAQHNEDCRKIWGITYVTGERGEFQRDRERIVNARAFRRMVDKAQIFTSSKGDHYRTRMTHTMEVAQIARSIANSLKLNIDLTEAIALGHDLGHTPFGHQGERTLQDILNHRIEVGLPETRIPNVYGGFKHNFQSVRVLNCLEEKYVEYDGLDVSYQVLEGVLKHTSYQQKDCGKCRFAVENRKCRRNCCDIDVFLREGDRSELYLEYTHSTTLEGQVVELADEIAQRSHDVDDAMTAGLMSYEQLLCFLKEHEMDNLKHIIDRSYDNLDSTSRRIVSKNRMICARVISDIVNYLVNDVIYESRKALLSFEIDGFYKRRHRFSQRLVRFSQEGGRVCEMLERMVNSRVIGSREVAIFDHNAEVIVKKLFRTYYESPALLNRGTLKKIEIEVESQTGQRIELTEGSREVIQNEMAEMTTKVMEGENEADRERRWKKHVILVRGITDYIAGMTDSYARNEYEALE